MEAGSRGILDRAGVDNMRLVDMQQRAVGGGVWGIAANMAGIFFFG